MKRTIVPVLLTLMLAGCASYSGIHTESSKLEAGALGARDISAEWPRSDWWLAFNDATLNRLIEQALRDSPNVQSADVRLRQARAIAGIADSATYPQLDASLNTTRERFSENGLVPPPYAGSTYNVNELSLSASWELDFFGRNREALKAALGELHATEAEHQAARIMIASEVASRYFALGRLQEQQRIAEQLDRQRSDLLAIAKQRAEAGIDASGDLEPLKGGVAEAHRDTAAIREQVALMRHAIAATLGQGPDATAMLEASLPASDALMLPQQIPLELLGHRADIVAAKWRVESGLHGMESAKASFYPNVNLRGFFGFSAVGFDKFLDAGSRLTGVGAAVSLPIFDAGHLRSEYRFVTAQTDGAIINYNKTLVNAFKDVADQVSTLDSVDQQLKKQQSALGNAEQSYALAQQRYAAGITGRMPVLNAEAASTQPASFVDRSAGALEHCASATHPFPRRWFCRDRLQATPKHAITEAIMANETSTAVPTNSPDAPNGKRKKLLFALLAACGIVSIGYTIYWATVSRYKIETDNAYVQGNVVQITPQVGGTVVAIDADDTDYVKAGQMLVRLDPIDARVALDQAEAQLASAVREVRGTFSGNDALKATVAAREADLARAQSDLSSS